MRIYIHYIFASCGCGSVCHMCTFTYYIVYCGSAACDAQIVRKIIWVECSRVHVHIQTQSHTLAKDSSVNNMQDKRHFYANCRMDMCGVCVNGPTANTTFARGSDQCGVFPLHSHHKHTHVCK